MQASAFAGLYWLAEAVCVVKLLASTDLLVAAAVQMPVIFARPARWECCCAVELLVAAVAQMPVICCRACAVALPWCVVELMPGADLAGLTASRRCR